MTTVTLRRNPAHVLAGAEQRLARLDYIAVSRAPMSLLDAMRVARATVREAYQAFRAGCGDAEILADAAHKRATVAVELARRHGLLE